MRVLSVVFVVVVYVWQTCQGAVLHQGPTSILRRHLPGPVPPEPQDLKGNDYIALKEYMKTVIKDKEMKDKISGGTGTQTSPERPAERRTRELESVPVYMTASKPPALPRHPPNPSLREAKSKAGGWRPPLQHLQPWALHIKPVEMPEVVSCKNLRRYTGRIPTAPPNVCDLCPDEDGKNPLAPCTCVGVGGTSTGQISISCPSSIVSLDQLRDIFQNTNFLVTHVFKFSLQGSNVDGALTRDIWGDLDFKYVSINNNKITDVDNGAFIASSETLIDLDLANNEIKNYIALYNDLPILQRLNLRGNNLSIIYTDDFKYPTLKFLDLSSNQISSIGKHSFAALKKLISLNLSNNLLTSIGDERFTFIDHDFSEVLVIDLSHNKISSISDTAFLGLRNVEINFKSNQLHTLDKTILQPIIISSQYYAFFHFTGNEMVCDCSIEWVLLDGRALLCFDNFLCTNNKKHLYSLTVSDLGNCSLSSDVTQP